MNAAIYARKSTEENGVADEAKSVVRQVEGARAFIADRGWSVMDWHVYTDDGVSGALFANRAEFQRMMRDAQAGAFEAVVFYDLDRFGRNARQTMLALNTLADLGVTIWDYSTGLAVDLDSFEGEMMTFMKARFAQQYRDQVRKHTRDAMRRKAEQGYVTGGKTFGYDNVGDHGQREWRINEAEAVVVREIYERTAAGDGARSIAEALNARGVAQPRAQQGRACGWSTSTIRAVLDRPLYRGIVVYGRSAKAYGRELRHVYRDTKREKGQIRKPEDTWVRLVNEDLRIVDPVLAERCDALRQDRRTRYLASVAKGGRVPERAHGKYLLSGGLLVCSTCGGHFEARNAPWRGSREVYICSTLRRKPGCCTNTLALPIAATDDAVLSVVEGEVLGTRIIEELLMLVDQGVADDGARLTADRDRLRTEVDRLVASIAIGVPADTVAPKIRERETEIAKLEARLRMPRQAPPNIERLRDALNQRTAQWRADLRAEPKVARMLLRRLVGPLTLWDAAATSPEWVKWEASITPERLLEGLAECPSYLVASPPGFEPGSRP